MAKEVSDVPIPYSAFMLFAHETAIKMDINTKLVDDISTRLNLPCHKIKSKFNL